MVILTGLAGQSYSLWSTTNLSTQPVIWNLLDSGILGATPILFNDLTATNSPAKFYRVSLP